MNIEISIEKIISEIKQSGDAKKYKKPLQHCEGLHQTLSSDGYVRSVVNWTRVTKPSRINALVAEFEKLLAERNQLVADNEKAMESIRQADAAVKLAHEKYSAIAAENVAARNAVQVFCDVVGENTDANIQSRDHYKRMTEEGLKQLAESRTVKLPREYTCYHGGPEGEDFRERCYLKDSIIRILTDAGIKWEDE